MRIIREYIAKYEIHISVNLHNFIGDVKIGQFIENIGL
jgi:hypothetical protein